MIIRKAYFILRSLKYQYLPRTKLIDLQNKNLRYLVKYVYRNNYFYHDLYKKNNVNIYNIRTIKDIKKLPMVTKQDLQLNYNRIIDLNIKPLNNKNNKYLQNLPTKKGIIRRTGGSTGLPLYVFFDNYAWDYAEATYVRSLFGVGYSMFDNLLVSNPFKEPPKKWFNYLFLFRKSYIPMELDIEKQINIIKNQRHSFMFYSYPTMLMLLAKKLDKKINKIKGIISTGERLTETNRKVIEDSFGCNVYNHYGTMELNRIAWECKNKEGFHMDIDSHIIEFLDNNEDVSYNETGEIVITNLHNYSFPLIRYRQGDRGIPIDDYCSCKRTLPLIKTIIGRDNDFIKLANGEFISPIPIDLSLSKIDGILQYQIIQKTLTNFEVNLVCNNNINNKEIINEINKIIKKIVNNENISLNYNFVDSIPRSKGGKLRTVISYLS